MKSLLDNRCAWVLWLAAVLGFFVGIIYVGNVEAVRKTGPAAGSTAFSSLYLTENVEDTGTQLNLTDTLTINPDQNASGDLIARGNGLSELFGVDVSAEQVTVHTLSDPDYGSLFAAARTTGGGADNDLVATLGEDDETSTVNSANTGFLTNVQVQTGSVEANQSTTPDTVANLRVEGTVTLDTNVSTDENFAFMVQDGPSWMEGTSHFQRIEVANQSAITQDTTIIEPGSNSRGQLKIRGNSNTSSNEAGLAIQQSDGTDIFRLSDRSGDNDVLIRNLNSGSNLVLATSGSGLIQLSGAMDANANPIDNATVVESDEAQLTQAAPCGTCAIRRDDYDADNNQAADQADTASTLQGPGDFGNLNITDLTVASPPTPGATDTGALIAHDGTGTPPPGLYSWRPNIGTGSWVHYSDTDEIGDQVITP